MPVKNINKILTVIATATESETIKLGPYDPVSFAKDYEEARKNHARGSKENNLKLRNESYQKLMAMRKFIQDQTIAITNDLKSEPAKIVTIPKMSTASKGTQQENSPPSSSMETKEEVLATEIPESKQEITDSSPAFPQDQQDMKTAVVKTKVRVVQKDCLYAAQELFQKTGKAPCVLNMANEFIPGGGYLHGSGAQEEDIFRRSTIVKHINPAAYSQQGFGDNTALYSSNIEVFRNGADKGYSFLAESDQFSINVIWSAALDLGKDVNQIYCAKYPEKQQEYQDRMKQRIRAQLAAALQNDQRHLILSAFGCGAFRNDPRVVAKLYAEVLQEPAFQGKFENIIFAIVPNPLQQHDNYGPFKKALDPFQLKTKQHINPGVGASITVGANLMNILDCTAENELLKGNYLPWIRVNESGQLELLIEDDTTAKNLGVNYNTDTTIEKMEDFFSNQHYMFKLEKLEQLEIHSVENKTMGYSHKLTLENPMDALRLISKDLNLSPEFLRVIYRNHAEVSPFKPVQEAIATKLALIENKGTSFIGSISRMMGNIHPLKPILEELQHTISGYFDGSNIEPIFAAIDQSKLKPNQKELLAELKRDLLVMQNNFVPVSTPIARI